MSPKLSLAFFLLLAIAFVACPRNPGRDRVKPEVLLADVLKADGCKSPHLAKLVQRNYIPLVEGEDTISGRDAWVLRLKPQAKRRPWKQLWVDKRTHEVLATRQWSWRNELMPGGERKAVPALPKAEVAFRTPKPHYMPSGYELLGFRRWKGDKVTQAVYSDGLFAVSVFMRFPAGSGREHTDVARAYDWESGSILTAGNVVVVGDLPQAELERIARSVL